MGYRLPGEARWPFFRSNSVSGWTSNGTPTVELAEKLLEITPKDYDIRANLAEYRARLGDAKEALAEIGRIPGPERKPRASRLAIAYELTGNRSQAIELIQSTLTNPASLNPIKDDPDLAPLWMDPASQKAIPRTAYNEGR
jgi:hypothetical protein